MKKFFALCSMIIALGFVTGCGGGKPPVPAAPHAPAPGGDAVAPDTGTDAPAAPAPGGDT